MPVATATSVTGSPAAASACAEPPVDRIATPRSARDAAKAAIPVLSLTEISARRIWCGVALIDAV